MPAPPSSHLSEALIQSPADHQANPSYPYSGKVATIMSDQEADEEVLVDATCPCGESYAEEVLEQDGGDLTLDEYYQQQQHFAEQHMQSSAL